MYGKSRGLKRKSRFHRWLVIMMTVALLVEQGNVTVLAEEENAPLETEISEGQEPGTGDNGAGSGDGGTVDDTSDYGDGNSGSTGSGANDGENGLPDDTGNGTGDNSGDDGTNDSGSDNDGNGDANQGDGEAGGNDGFDDSDEDAGEQCICEVKCTVDSVNVDCPVCTADYDSCVGKTEGESGILEEVLEEESVSENDLAAEAEITALADEGVEAYAVGDKIIYDGLRYRVTGAGEVEVFEQGQDAVSGDIVIPGSFEEGGDIYQVTKIRDYAFFRCSGLTSVKISDGVMSIGKQAFSECDHLIGVEIPGSVTGMGNSVFKGCSGLTSVKIPDGVISIGERAFEGCSGLISVEIPESVTSIGYGMFLHCSSLINVEIPGSVTSIGSWAFGYCSSLASVTMSSNVTSIGPRAFFDCFNLISVEIPESVTSIGDSAFNACHSLTSIEIPKNVTSIGRGVFGACISLTDITIPSGVKSIEQEAFMACSSLKEMRIVLQPDKKYKFPTVEEFAFYALPTPKDRKPIIFVDEQGNELSEAALQAADVESAFKEAIKEAKNAGYPDDGTWYGWTIGELSEITDTYKVTIGVQKDGALWIDDNRSFALSKDKDATFVTDLNAVENGIYSIYDITGIKPDLYAKGVDTGVDVTVADREAQAEVNYYTVTFYDEADTYQAGTPQEPQIVLNGKQAGKPADPSKTGWQFAGWKTTKDGSDEYKFDSVVTGTTAIYASWVKEAEKPAEKLTITASAAEGGTIAPIGYVTVTKGGEKTFTITPDEGNRIKTVIVDNRDVTGELADTLARAQAGARYYTFTDVTVDHTIHAEFEGDGSIPGGEDPNPGGGDTPNPGGGDNTGDNIKPGGGDNTGDDNHNPGGGSGSGGSTTPASDGGNSGDSGSSLDGGSGSRNTDGSVVNEALIASGQGTAAGASGQSANGTEPKTGDASHMEIYATLAMIAALTYMLLYFMDEAPGMSDREKDAFVAAFIRWGKKGGLFRKGCAVVAIFFLLAYYHSVGKRAGEKKDVAISF